MNHGEPITIHQSSSKALTYHHSGSENIIISGGDDGSLAFFRTAPADPGSRGVEWRSKPVIIVRAHTSAVTACTTITHNDRIFVLTSGNDQWMRLWEIVLTASRDDDIDAGKKDWAEVKRICRVKTNVADVSSMTELSSVDEEDMSKVLICGVGMEVMAIKWDSISM